MDSHPGDLPMCRVALLICLIVFAPLCADEPKKVETKVKEIAGVAEFLRGVPKHFATLQNVDAARRRVTLLIEGENLAKTWDVAPDAEVKLAAWRGRLEQFKQRTVRLPWFHADP